MWFFVAALVIGFLVTTFLAPKPHIENARASNLSDFNFPRASEGAPVPRIYGTVKTLGVNTIGECNFVAAPIKKKVKTGLFSSKKVITGYKYYIGLDLGVALGEGVVYRRLWYGKHLIWAGCLYREPCVTRLHIDLPELLGGADQNGGIGGWIALYCGDYDQPQNDYLQTNLATAGDTFPAYPGIAHMVFEDFWWGNSASIETIAAEVSYFNNSLGLEDEKHVMPNGLDANPVAVLYDLYVNDWGNLGVTDPIFNVANWQAAAYTVYAEGNGCSLEIANPNTGADLTKEILRQINATIFTDPSTGEINIKLMRSDYDVALLPVLGPNEIATLNNFAKKLWKDTFNRVRISYKDRDNDYNTAVATADDFGNIRYQSRLTATDVSYPGVYDGDLANQLAARDLANLCVPLYHGDVTLNRTHTDLLPGSLFVLAWPEYGIAGIVVRINKVSLGARKDGMVAMSFVQEQLADASVVYGSPVGAGGLTDGTSTTVGAATAIAERAVREAPYFLAQAAGVAIAAGQSVLAVTAKAPSADVTKYDIYTSIDAGVSYNASEEDVVFGDIGSLNTAITGTTNLATGVIASIDVVIGAIDDLEVHTAAQVAQGAGLFLIGNELFAYEGITVAAGTATLTNVWRALLDTAPAAHAIADSVYFLGGGNVVDDQFPEDATVKVKLASKTYNNALAYTAAPTDSIDLHKRASRPLPPGAIKFGAGAIMAPPANGATPQVLTWANRKRTSKSVRKLADLTSEYEVGQQTVIRWRKNAGAWTQLTYGPGIKTATIDTGSIAGDTIDWEIWASRDGYDSYAKWQFTSGAAAATGSSPETSVATGSGAPSTPADTTAAAGDTNSVTIVFPWGESIGTYPIDIPVTFPFTIPAGLVGTNVDHATNPTGAATFTLKKNGVAFATVAISVAGAYTLTAAADTKFVANDSLSCEPPAVEDATLKGVSIGVAATRN